MNKILYDKRLIVVLCTITIILLIVLLIPAIFVRSGKKTSITKPTISPPKSQIDKSNTITILPPTPTKSVSSEKKIEYTPPTIGPTKTISEISKEGIIAKVGNEYIYKKDLETELLYYPTRDEKAKKILTEKLVNDSKILQAAADSKLINLESDVYNSANKSYLKRVDLVVEAQNALKMDAGTLKGTIVAIWFMNDKVGSIGSYEKAKDLALSKITNLHDQVKQGKITILQAGEMIKNDTTLAQIDTNYKYNAIFNFTISGNQKITWESAFDEILKQLPVGTVSDVYLGKSFNLPVSKTQKIDAYYMFGQINEKSNYIQNLDFNTWLKTKKDQYEVLYY